MGDGVEASSGGGSEAPPKLQIESGWRGIAWQLLFPAFVVVLVVAIPITAWVGKEALLDTRGGRAAAPVVDPKAPGYEAVVEPTPTMLLLQVNADDTLVGLTLLAQSGETSGSVLFIPVNTVVPAEVVEGAVGETPDETSTSTTAAAVVGPTSVVGDTATTGTLPATVSPTIQPTQPTQPTVAASPAAVPLKDAYRDGGTDAVVSGVEALLGTGIGDRSVEIEGETVDREDAAVASIDDARWAELVEPLAPLTVNNLDPVMATDAAGQPVEAFPAGDLELDADQVGQYLSLPAANELARIDRHQALWLAWLDAIGRSGDPGAVPGETEVGLGAFLRELTTRTVDFYTLPVTTVGVFGATEELFLPDEAEVDEIMSEIVPFPIGSEANPRPVVRVLDGSGTAGAALSAAQLVIAAGGEVHLMGNAATFDHVKNQVVYYDEGLRGEAERMAEVLGGAEVTLSSDPEDVVNLSIIVGTDFTSSADLGNEGVTIEGVTTTVGGGD